MDLFPTLCELCGLEPPAHLQGKSLAPVLKNPQASHRDSAYSSYPHNRGKGLSKVTGHSIRTERHRFTQWWDSATDNPVHSVLTDIEADPGETTAIANARELEESLTTQLRMRVLSARKTGLNRSK